MTNLPLCLRINYMYATCIVSPRRCISLNPLSLKSASIGSSNRAPFNQSVSKKSHGIWYRGGGSAVSLQWGQALRATGSHLHYCSIIILSHPFHQSISFPRRRRSNKTVGQRLQCQMNENVSSTFDRFLRIKSITMIIEYFNKAALYILSMKVYLIGMDWAT